MLGKMINDFKSVKRLYSKWGNFVSLRRKISVRKRSMLTYAELFSTPAFRQKSIQIRVRRMAR